MKLKLTTISLLLLSTLLFGQDGWQTFAEENYSIQYPSDWEYSDKKTQPNLKFLLLSDSASQNKDMFRENINLITESLGSASMSLEAYTSLSLNQIKTQLPTAKIISNQTTTINGMQASDIIWIGDFSGYQLKFRQLLFINNKSAYIMTYSSTTDEFDAYKKVADDIVNTFKFAR